jgi:hypothetical protein
LQGEVVDPKVWKDVVNDGKRNMSRIEWAITYGIMGFQHGMGADGGPDLTPMGKFHKYRIIGDKIEVEGSMPMGSEKMDSVWGVVKSYATSAGFSIGGTALDKIKCDANGQNCTLVKADVVEISWCIEPANPEAKVTDVAMVKAMASKALVVPITNSLTRALNKLFACKDCDDYITDLVLKGKKASQAMLSFSNILEADPPTPGNIGGTTMPEAEATKTAPPPTPAPEVLKAEEKPKDKDEKKPEKDKEDEEKKAMAVRIEELTKMIKDLTDTVNKMNTPKPIETAKAISETKPVFATTETEAIEKLLKSGKQIVGYAQGTPDGAAEIQKTAGTESVLVASAKRIVPK